MLNLFRQLFGELLVVREFLADSPQLFEAGAAVAGLHGLPLVCDHAHVQILIISACLREGCWHYSAATTAPVR